MNIVGYYLGQRPAEAAEKHAREAAGQSVEYRTTLASDIKNDIEHISSEQERELLKKENYGNMLTNINKHMDET